MVKKIEQRLLEMQKPQLVPVRDLQLSTKDALVVCAGFEDRAFKSLEKARSTQSKRFRCVSVEYLPHVEENRKDELEELAGDCEASLEWCVYDRRDPADGAMRVADLLKDVKGEILVDISGMSKLLIVQLIVELSVRRRCACQP
jgi:hypothetical protein